MCVCVCVCVCVCLCVCVYVSLCVCMCVCVREYFTHACLPVFQSLNLFVYLHSSLSKLSEERFYTIVQFKSLRALADPGEAVGLLAAQVCTYMRG